MKELANKFPRDAHKFRLMNLTKKKDKGSFAVYIDARNVMDRLDEVVGPEGWADEYKPILSSDDKWVVQCWLTVNGVTKSDVGEDTKSVFSNADPKAAYSDALKRAAVKFGIGRYLYALDTDGWYPVDEWKNFTPQSMATINRIIDKQLGTKQIANMVLDNLPEISGGEVSFTAKTQELIDKLRRLHEKSQDFPMEKKQYGHMTGLINEVVGEDKRKATLKLIFGYDVDHEHPPGKAAVVLLDALKSDNEPTKKALKDIAAKVAA